MLYLPEYLDLLPGHECCSDTEVEGTEPLKRSIGLPWRSAKYTTWLHQVDQLTFKHQSSVHGRHSATRRFDTARVEGNTFNPMAPVCSKLPEDCYDAEFFEKQLSDLDKLTLQIKPKSAHLDQALEAVAKHL